MGAKRIEDLLAGGPVIVNDVLADPRFAADEGAQASYRAFGARSSINVPLIRDERPRAFLFVANAEPRAWTETEIALARETLERAWQAVERARAEEALRLTTARFELALKGSPVVLFCQDLDLRYTWIYNPALGYDASEVVGKSDTDIFERAEDAAATEAIKREVIRTGIAKRGEFLIHEEGVDRYYDLLVDPLHDGAGHIKGVRCAAIDITERKREQQHIRLLMREVNHRSKNILTLVQAVARQTAATKPVDFLGRFDERLRALAASQDLVVKNEWRGVDLNELIFSQLMHFKDLIGTRIDLNGPPLFISASAAQTIGMALHELATNAGKYGALSNQDGRIDVLWHLDHDERGHDIFVMAWNESGGPPVSPPTCRGFGSTLISRIVKASLNAEVELNYPASGLFWRMTCNAKVLLDAVDRGS
jgi:PAS domain S-box-containing protein